MPPDRLGNYSLSRARARFSNGLNTPRHGIPSNSASCRCRTDNAKLESQNRILPSLFAATTKHHTHPNGLPRSRPSSDNLTKIKWLLIESARLQPSTLSFDLTRKDISLGSEFNFSAQPSPRLPSQPRPPTAWSPRMTRCGPSHTRSHKIGASRPSQSRCRHCRPGLCRHR